MGAGYLPAWIASSALDTLLHVGFVILIHWRLVDARIHENFLQSSVMKCEAASCVRAVSDIAGPFSSVQLFKTPSTCSTFWRFHSNM
jgi:hypothetical protein